MFGYDPAAPEGGGEFEHLIINLNGRKYFKF